MAAEAEWRHLGLRLQNRYTLQESLAHGALCDVYKGEDEALRRPIAIKVAPPQWAETYRKALRATATFTHPSAVAIYDALEVDNRLFLALEYVPSRPLSAFLRDGMPTERAVDIGSQVARALVYAHARGMTHGDLTPAAVLMDRHALAHINNFGLPADAAYFARFDDALLPPDAERAPDDTLAGYLEPAPAEDVRALGLILWRLLCAQGSGAFRSDVAPPVRELITRAVWRGHPQRIADAETLAQELAAAGKELARRREQAEATPPAIRAMRSQIAREASWSIEETLSGAGYWGGTTAPVAMDGPPLPASPFPASPFPVSPAAAPSRDGAGESRRSMSDTIPEPLGVSATQPTEAVTPPDTFADARPAPRRMAPAPTPAAPRLRLPSRPIAEVAVADPPVAAPAAPWPDGRRSPAPRQRQRRPVPMLVWIVLGLALFLLFFVAGVLGLV